MESKEKAEAKMVKQGDGSDDKKEKKHGISGKRRSKRMRKRNTKDWKKRKTMIIKRKKGLEKTIAKEAKTNPKSFYSYINRGRNMRSKVGPLKEEIDGKTIQVVEPKRQAEMLNNFFASVFTKSEGDVPVKDRHPGVKTVEDVFIDEERIKEIIERLKEKSAPGPDGVPNKLIIELANPISRAYSILFNKSLNTGTIPDEWRYIKVTPIYKKGAKSEPGNYRPVSLTSATCKLMERIIKEALEKHLEKNGLIGNSHGFRYGRSPQTNLIEFLEKLTVWLDEGRSFDVIYLDFAKAFDVVCHKRLIIKLREKGIEGKLLALIQDWLSKRKQRVVVEGETSGGGCVLQGSFLGDILFSIYIDDLDEEILAWICKFADDTKLAKIMQVDLDKLEKWAVKWKMKYNVDKCNVLVLIHFGKRNRKFEKQSGRNENKGGGGGKRSQSVVP